jgi:hypothetical protein
MPPSLGAFNSMVAHLDPQSAPRSRTILFLRVEN